MLNIEKELLLVIKNAISEKAPVYENSDKSELYAKRCGDACTGTCRNGCQGDKKG